MLLGVPIAATLYKLIKLDVTKRLQEPVLEEVVVKEEGQEGEEVVVKEEGQEGQEEKEL